MAWTDSGHSCSHGFLKIIEIKYGDIDNHTDHIITITIDNEFIRIQFQYHDIRGSGRINRAYH